MYNKYLEANTYHRITETEKSSIDDTPWLEKIGFISQKVSTLPMIEPPWGSLGIDKEKKSFVSGIL